MTDGAGHSQLGIVRGCPLKTGRDCAVLRSHVGGEDHAAALAPHFGPAHRQGAQASWSTALPVYQICGFGLAETVGMSAPCIAPSPLSAAASGSQQQQSGA